MAYLGNTPASRFTSMDKQTITGDGGTGYTLDHAVGSEQEIEVFVNNVRQEPSVAYTVVGTALTMTGNVASTDDFYVVFQGKAQQTVVPPDGSVTNAKIDTMAASKLTGTLNTTNFPVGSIVQTQTNSHSTEITLTTSFQDLFSVNITPLFSNSIIKIEWCLQYFISQSSAGADLIEVIYRDATLLSNNIQGLTGYSFSRSFNTTMWLDSAHNSTSQLTYKIQAKIGTSDAGKAFESDRIGFITATEIKQ